MEVVFDTRPRSGYDDSIERYHFPKRYIRDASAAVGDWAIFYEPSRENGRRAYVAVANVERIEPDLSRPSHHFAVLRDYLPFDRPVPLRGSNGYREARLRQVVDPKDVGRALQGRSVRELSEEDFYAIVKAGLQELNMTANVIPPDAVRGGPGLQTDFDLDAASSDRRIAQVLANRTIRDAVFRRVVLAAYDNTCALTGLRIFDESGNAEAQAAHILPVAAGGPDVVQNGIALSATAHWLFDRHLVSIDKDWRVLVRRSRVPSVLRSIIMSADDRMRLPKDPALWPHPAFLAGHREHFSSD